MRVYDGLLEAGVQVARPIPLVAVAAQRLPERQPISHRHQVVEDRIYGRGEIVKTAGNVVQPFVDFSVVRSRSIGVKVEQSLGVKRGPAQEEGDDDGGCNNKIFADHIFKTSRGATRKIFAEISAIFISIYTNFGEKPEL